MPLAHGGHGWYALVFQFVSTAPAGSSAALTSARMDISGRSSPMLVPYSTPLPYVGATPFPAPACMLASV